MRLIDADALISAIEKGEGISWERYGDNEVCVRKKYIDNAPTIAWCNRTSDGLPLLDLRERPQGEWIVTAEDNDGVHRICCPFCSYEKGSNNTDNIIVTFSNFPKFCENCGADMRKGGAE